MNLAIRIVACLALLGMSLPGQALAHGLLIQTVPAAEAVVAEPPVEISLSFNEQIEARFSGIDLLGPDGAAIAIGEIAVIDKNMVAPVLDSLLPGVYQVDWHVLSADGHKVAGSYKFEVKP
jgi:copper resistance protein C